MLVVSYMATHSSMLSRRSFHSLGKLDCESMGTDKNVFALFVHASYKTCAQLSVFSSKFRLIRVVVGSHPRGTVNLTWSRNAKLWSMVGCLRRSFCRTMAESSEHTSTGILACCLFWYNPRDCSASSTILSTHWVNRLTVLCAYTHARVPHAHTRTYARARARAQAHLRARTYARTHACRLMACTPPATPCFRR